MIADEYLQVLTGNLIASMFLLVRLIYFCLAIFSADHVESIWNPLIGSVAALVCMALLPEFLVLMVYAGVGWTIDVSRNDEQSTRERSQQQAWDKVENDGRLA